MPILLQVKAQSKDELYDSPRSYDGKRSSSSVASSEVSAGSGKAVPPPTAAKPVLATKPIIKPPVSVIPPVGNNEGSVVEGTNAPKSVLGKVKIFEKMDFSARQQRMQELHEAQNARVRINNCKNYVLFTISIVYQHGLHNVMFFGIVFPPYQSTCF